MKYLAIALLFFGSLTSYSQKKEFRKYNFKELLTECNITYKTPRGFNETPVISDNGHLYQYAIKDSTTGFEARFYVKPYKIFYQNDPSYDKDPLTYNFFVSALLNTSGFVLPNYPDVKKFGPEIMKDDFNADYGLWSYFEPKSKFGEGYKNCEVFAIRKDTVGEVYIFMLYNIQNRETKIIRDDILSSIDFK
ncbi:hypothetical protein [Flavobacterium pedocola]